tara:strand:+ start:2059 stop:4512 length:2454 start_codon:yes stop_codon:yes gene_type:complete
MADDKGSVEIDVVVDASEAVDGFKKAGEAASDMAEKLEETEKQVKKTGKELSDTKEDAEDLGDGFEKLGKKGQESAAFVEDMKKRLGGLQTEAQQAGDQLEGLGQEIEDLPSVQPPSKPIADSLPDDSDIEGLSRFRDTTGEADSAIAGMAAAADHLSPEMASLMRVIGDASGGMEAASRATALFGGSLGSLIRIGGPVALAIGAIAFAHSKMSSKAKDAEKALEKQHEEMMAGIQAAKAYAARMRSVRVTLGTLSAQEARLRDSREEAVQGLSHQADRMQAVRQRTNTLRQAFNLNTTALNAMNTAGGSANIAFVEAEEALEAAGRAARGEAGSFDRTGQSAGSLRVNHEELVESTRRIRHAMEAGERAIDQFDNAVKRDQAQILISNAIRSGEVDVMIEATDQLENLDGALRDSAEAQLLQAISTAQAAEQAEKEADAAEKAAAATKERADANNALIDAQDKLRMMLAEADGEIALIQERYRNAVKEINELVKTSGATEEEAAKLINKARKDRIEAVEAYNESLKASEEEAADFVFEKEKTRSEQIQDEFKQREADLKEALSRQMITQQEFDDQRIMAEERMNDELALLRNEQAQQAINNVGQFSGAFLDMINANIDAVTSKLDAEQEAALSKVEKGSEEAEKIEREFEMKRRQALEASFKKRKQLEVANALVSGAGAVVAAIAPPPVGLGPVAGAFLATAIAATTAAQIATIQNQNPKFHSGGIVGGDGDQPITAQGGEVVLSRDAVAQLGGPDAANSLNDGGMPGGTTVIQMTYKQKVFDQVVIDNLAKGGPLKNALNTATRRGRRGRVGGRL